MIISAWVKQVLAGEKEWLKALQVVHANPPRYDEISVKNLYDYAMTLDNMTKYFPSSYPKERSCNREYFFSIVVTIQPKYFEQLIRKCKDARFAIDTEE